MDFVVKENGVVVKNGNEFVGELTLVKQAEHVYQIVRVYVLDAYRGQGIAGKLVQTMVEHARKNNFKLVPLCSYSVKEFERNKTYHDVLFVQ